MHGPGSGVHRGCGMRQWALACVLVAAACGGASQSNVRPLGGILTVAPATLDFGDVALGREQTQRVVLRNTGLVSMTVGQLAQFADPAFEVKGLPETLGPGSATATSRTSAISPISGRCWRARWETCCCR